MGQSLVRAANAAGLAICGGSERAGNETIGKDIGVLAGLPPLNIAVSDSPAAAAKDAQVWIDFTAPEATLAALENLNSTPVRAIVIGTTGFSEAQLSQLNTHAARYAIVRAGNFSLGVNLLCALAEQAAARLDPAWDIEILETHHRHKRDAPSGTALMLGDAAAAGRGVALKDVRLAPYDGVGEPRPKGAIGFSVRRSGGVIGEHEISFASSSEIVSLSHQALDRSVFADGALAAARWAVDKPPGQYSMRDVLGL